MKRSLKFSLDLGNTGKKKAIDALYEEYAKLVNYYLELLSKYDSSFLDEELIQSVNSILSARFRQCAARQASKIWKIWLRTPRSFQFPRFSGALVLDQRFLEVQRGKNSFDYWVKLSTNEKGKRITIPFKSFRYANTYFANWSLRKGGKLQNIDGTWYLILCFEKATPTARSLGEILGVDIGYRKLVTTSNGFFYGSEVMRLAKKISRRRQGSKRWKKATIEMKNYVNQVAKQLFTSSLRVLVTEKLKNLKRNKSGLWSRRVNRLFNFWLYGHLLCRLGELGELHGVHVEPVKAAYTSQTCPKCGYIDSLNRQGELFNCQQCGFANDADIVGAMNIRSRFVEQSRVAQVGIS